MIRLKKRSKLKEEEGFSVLKVKIKGFEDCKVTTDWINQDQILVCHKCDFIILNLKPDSMIEVDSSLRYSYQAYLGCYQATLVRVAGNT